MAHNNYSKEKLVQYKIAGQTKPFIDKNLQLQIPGIEETPRQVEQIFNPIYSHYVGSFQPHALSLQVNEIEIHQTINKTKNSYDAWKKMQNKLKKVVETYQIENKN